MRRAETKLFRVKMYPTFWLDDKERDWKEGPDFFTQEERITPFWRHRVQEWLSLSLENKHNALHPLVPH